MTGEYGEQAFGSYLKNQEDLSVEERRIQEHIVDRGVWSRFRFLYEANSFQLYAKQDESFLTFRGMVRVDKVLFDRSEELKNRGSLPLEKVIVTGPDEEENGLFILGMKKCIPNSVFFKGLVHQPYENDEALEDCCLFSVVHMPLRTDQSEYDFEEIDATRGYIIVERDDQFGRYEQWLSNFGNLNIEKVLVQNVSREEGLVERYEPVNPVSVSLSLLENAFDVLREGELV